MYSIFSVTALEAKFLKIMKFKYLAGKLRLFPRKIKKDILNKYYLQKVH